MVPIDAHIHTHVHSNFNVLFSLFLCSLPSHCSIVLQFILSSIMLCNAYTNLACIVSSLPLSVCCFWNICDFHVPVSIFFALLQRPNNHSLTSAFCVGFNEKFRLGRWFSMCDCFHFKEWNPRGGWIASVNPIRINRLWILLNLIYTLTQTHTFYAYYSLRIGVCVREENRSERGKAFSTYIHTQEYIISLALFAL